jgi:hypothetical protein
MAPSHARPPLTRTVNPHHTTGTHTHTHGTHVVGGLQASPPLEDGLHQRRNLPGREARKELRLPLLCRVARHHQVQRLAVSQKESRKVGR